jgi:hypothetical protein
VADAVTKPYHVVVGFPPAVNAARLVADVAAAAVLIALTGQLALALQS